MTYRLPRLISCVLWYYDIDLFARVRINQNIESCIDGHHARVYLPDRL